MTEIKEKLLKHKEVLLYLIFGGLTTVINFVVYLLLDGVIHDTGVSTIAAWVVSVLFAFVTNKLFVFESKSFQQKHVLQEILSFMSFRILSGVLDLGIMVIGVDILKGNKMLVKVFSNVLVVVLNYVASKLFIFKPKEKK